MNSKSEYSGLFIQFTEENRREKLRERCYDGGEFTDAFSASDWRFQPVEVALLSFASGLIDCFCLVERGHRVVTEKVLVKFQRFIPLDSLALEELEDEIEAKVRGEFRLFVEGGSGRFTAETWGEVIDALRRIRPREAEDIDRLLAEREGGRVQFPREAAAQLAEERDALGVALDIFDTRRELRPDVLKCYVKPKGEPAPFLKGLDQLRLTEQQMLAHDSGVFGALPIESRPAFSTRFESPTGILEVLYLNETRVEKALGVDLIYYHHEFDAYTLIQYKRMNRSYPGDDWKFYPDSDGNFHSEAERMRKFVEAGRSSSASPGPGGCRLNPESAYFKFCPLEQPSLKEGELIRGLYLPLTYLDLLFEDDRTTGPKGGRVLTFKNAVRHMSNTEFTSLVQKGWIGTTGIATNRVTEVIYAALSAGRAVIHARSISKNEH